jgi:hypothetical protein
LLKMLSVSLNTYMIPASARIPGWLKISQHETYCYRSSFSQTVQFVWRVVTLKQTVAFTSRRRHEREWVTAEATKPSRFVQYITSCVVSVQKRLYTVGKIELHESHSLSVASGIFSHCWGKNIPLPHVVTERFRYNIYRNCLGDDQNT